MIGDFNSYIRHSLSAHSVISFAGVLVLEDLNSGSSTVEEISVDVRAYSDVLCLLMLWAVLLCSRWCCFITQLF